MSSELVKAAERAASAAYAPYSKFNVGVAVRAANGSVYCGCNIENASYPQGWCAEPSAISAMVLDGQVKITEVCVWAASEAPIVPCGGCRQKLAEFGAADVIVISAGPQGERNRWTLGDLLPEAFSLEGEG